MKKIHRLFTAVLCAMPALALTGQSVEVSTATGRHVIVKALTPDIIRVENTAPGARPSSTVPLPAHMVSTGTVSREGDTERFTTPAGITVHIDRHSGAVTIGNGSASGTVSDNGVRTLADGKRTLSLSTMGAGGSFYGAGERGHSFNLAGDTLVMYNKQNYEYKVGEDRIRQMNICMPLFISSNGYAVVFDDYAAATMVMSDPIVYTTEGCADVSYMYVGSAGSTADLMRKLSGLIGRQPLPPLWALGYITSKYGYRTQAEASGVVDTLKSQGYPLDGIVLDLYWYGREQDMGRLAWDSVQWPSHRAMLDSLKSAGVNTVLISQPYVLANGRGADNFNELSSRGMLVADSAGTTLPVQIWVGEGGMLDVSNPDTRAWLANRYRELTQEGVGGWWGDLGEPEVHPDVAVHANGLGTRLYHNRYGNDWSSIIDTLYRDSFPDRRLMTMMRGGTTGLQRHSVYPWSTDVSRSWGGLQPQITIMLNSGLSGLGYMSHDVGGFAIDAEHPYDPELYVRWMQLGTFSPILRTHAQATAEPYNYPAQQHIILPLVRERYRWLPYNYTLAWQNASEGHPLVRPLGYHSPGGTARWDGITDQYLWGRDVMVAPVLTQGATERTVVFPDGEWVDMSRPDSLYHGGDTVTYPAPLEVLPMFVRGGAFIPLADYDMENTGGYRTDRYTVNYYPILGNTHYTLFEDDLTTPSTLGQGRYLLTTFTGDSSPRVVRVDIRTEGDAALAAVPKQLTLAVHRITARPRSVSVDGRKVHDWSYDAAAHTLAVTLEYSPTVPLRVDIER